MPRRGKLLSRQTVIIQRLAPVKRPGGSMESTYVDDHTAECSVIPLNALDRVKYAQPGLTITHKVRFEGDPWAGNPKQGYLVNGWRIAFPVDAPVKRILLYKGGYSPQESGRMFTAIFQEDSQAIQFQH